MFGKKKEEAPMEAVLTKEEEIVVEAPVVPVISAAVEKTIIGAGAKFIGDFETDKEIEIHGKLEGNITKASSVYVAQTGFMKGNGTVENATVEGVIEGDIKCTGTTHITSTGKLSGSLLTARLVTDDGSSFDGKLDMLKPKAK